MYGVLYAATPEIFPAKDRGTGNGLTAIATRVFSVLVCAFVYHSRTCELMYALQAPIIALAANLDTSVPVYISGALIIVAGFVALLLPFEPRGKSSL